MENIYKRIEYLIEKHGISKAKLAKETGVSTGNMGDWKRGKSTPSVSALIRIATFFHVSLDWLATGEVHPSYQENTQSVQGWILTDEEKELVELFRKVEKEKQIEITGMIKLAIAMHTKKDEG